MPAIINLLIAFSFAFSADATLPQRGICAHRGAMDTHPENTVAAFREAVRLGVHMIEFDVRMTKDGKLVILHDETVDRTTNGHGAVKDKTLTEIKKLDAGSWKSTIFKEERIPTLREALAVMPQNIWLNVHLKGDTKLAEEAAKVLYEEARLKHAFLTCGKDAADAAKRVVKEVMICNSDRPPVVEDYVNLSIQLKSEFVQLLSINPQLTEHTDKLKRHGVQINYCCSDDPEQMRKLFDYGVDFILVNHVEPALKVTDSMGIKRVH
ncbi:MAG: glycerophosphodiester phosphodiesterase family protein [Bacteroidota bacterium]